MNFALESVLLIIHLMMAIAKMMSLHVALM